MEEKILAKYLKIPKRNVKEIDDTYYGFQAYECKVGNKIETYILSSDEYDIKKGVEESLENLYDAIGMGDFAKNVLPWLGGVGEFINEDDLENYFYNYYLDYAKDISKEDDGKRIVEEAEQLGLDMSEYSFEDGEWDNKLFEDMAQALVDGLNGDYLEELRFNYDSNDVSAVVEEYCTLDFENIAQNSIDNYGAGHELASYDGRTNEFEYDGELYYIFKQDARDAVSESLKDNKVQYGESYKSLSEKLNAICECKIR